MRGKPEPILEPAGTFGWWQQVKGKCIAGGAGLTGKVILDGVAFSLPNHTPLPTMTIQPGAAMGAWTQTDAFGFSGYGED